MKKVLLSLLIFLMLSTSVFAINVNEIFFNLQNQSNIISKMNYLITVYTAGEIDTGDIVIPLSPAQKATILSKYNTLKNQLIALKNQLLNYYSQLP